jgi:hypothetical protein
MTDTVAPETGERYWTRGNKLVGPLVQIRMRTAFWDGCNTWATDGASSSCRSRDLMAKHTAGQDE